MANVLSNFLVGIGMDTANFDKGARSVESGIGTISKSALQLGAVAAGAFGARQLTVGFAQTTDKLGKFSQVFGVIPNEVAAIGRALEHEGGSLESFMSQLAGIEQLRASTPQQIGALFATAGVVGVDPRVILDADNATEAYLALSDVIENLTGKQRLQAAKVFGLDEASIRLLSNYRQDIDKLVDRERTLRTVTKEMTDESARFKDATQDLQTNIGAQADVISMRLLPAISSGVEGMNSFLEANRSLISVGIDKTFDAMGDSVLELSIAAVALVNSGLFAGIAGMAKSVPLIGAGLSTAVIAASKLSAIGAAGFGGYAVGSLISENLETDTNTDIGRVITRILAVFGNDEAQQNLVREARVGGFTEGYSTESNPLQQWLFPELAAEQQRYTTLPESEINRSAQQQRTQQPVQTRMPPINVTLQLDGNVIDQRIIDVSEQLNETTINDLTSSVRD